MKKMLSLFVSLIAATAVAACVAISGVSTSTAQATSPAQSARQMIANPAGSDPVVAAFTVEMLPTKAGDSPSQCTVQWSHLVLPYEWPWASVKCRAGSGKYRVKATFMRIISLRQYSKKGPIVKVGKTSTVRADGGFDYATSARWQQTS